MAGAGRKVGQQVGPRGRGRLAGAEGDPAGSEGTDQERHTAPETVRFVRSRSVHLGLWS